MINEIKNDISGLAALRDWLGDGDAVHEMVAEFRGGRCTTGNSGKPCPLNRGQGWIETAKGEVANWIRKELEVKNGMQLRVSMEDDLHICKACSCFLALKVWIARSHLKAHTTQEQIDKTPPYCWIRQELREL